MKVIQVNVVYKTGSTGKIVYELHKEYQEKIYRINRDLR